MGLLISSTLRFLRLRSKPTVFLLGFVLLGLTENAEASGWQIEVVDSLPYIYAPTVLKLDHQGFFHIAYASRRDSILRYAHWNGTGWVIEIPDSANIERRRPSLVLDARDWPHIAYGDKKQGSLKHTFWDGTQWRVEVVDTGGVGIAAALALDRQGFPHITYSDTIWYRNALKYVYWDGSSWIKKGVIDSFSTSGAPALVLDSLDRPHVAYRYNPSECLKYACWDGNQWQRAIVDTSGGNAGIYPNLRLNSQGKPLISHIAGNVAFGVMLSRWKDSLWNTEMVDWYPRMVTSDWLYLSPKDSVSVAHTVDEFGVFVTIQTENGWRRDTVVEPGIMGGASLAVDTANVFHLSYLTTTRVFHAWKDFSGVNEKGTVSLQSLTFRISPNPFQRETRVILQEGVMKKGYCVRIYDTVGRLMRKMEIKSQQRGCVVWDGRDEKGRLMSAGVYCVVLEGGVQRISQPVVLIR